MDTEAVRLQLMEHRIRRYRNAFAVVGIVLIAMVTMALTGAQDVIRCNRLEILDRNGKVAIAAFGGLLGGRMDVYNGDGNVTTTISHTFADPALAGTGLLSMASKEGLVVVEVRGDANGGRVLLLNRTRTRDEVVRMYANQEGDGVVGVWNREGEGRVLKP